MHPEEAPAAPSLRNPVPPAGEDGLAENPTPTAQRDPCEDLRAENVRLNEEIALLLKENDKLRWNDYTSPFGRFLRSADAEMMGPEDIRKVEMLMTGSNPTCPVVLQPGEAFQLVVLWDDSRPYDSIEEAVIRFLGPLRLLAEAPPEWIRDWRDELEEWWPSFFGYLPD